MVYRCAVTYRRDYGLRPARRWSRRAGCELSGSIWVELALVVSFQQVVHPARTEDAGVARLQSSREDRGQPVEAPHLVGGEVFAVDASLIQADANKLRSVPGHEWRVEDIPADAT